ncbi:NAD(P)-dependent alcohol dehydrogenase [Bradyrhizobium sp. 6(2017)]
MALNARDLMMIESGMGLAREFRFIPASDMAGVVEAEGDSIRRFGPGERVITTVRPSWIDGPSSGSAAGPSYRTLGGYYPGALAEYVCFPEDWFTAAPATLDDLPASTLPVAGLMAWFLLIEQGRLKAAETVLVPGTGGVAIFAGQTTRMHGAEVIVSSGSDDKLHRARALGAVHLINRNKTDVVREVQALTPTAPILVTAPTIQGIVTGHRRALEDLVRAVDRSRLKPSIDRRYSFDKLPEAPEPPCSRVHSGKLSSMSWRNDAVGCARKAHCASPRSPAKAD